MKHTRYVTVGKIKRAPRLCGMVPKKTENQPVREEEEGRAKMG